MHGNVLRDIQKTDSMNRQIIVRDKSPDILCHRDSLSHVRVGKQHVSVM